MFADEVRAVVDRADEDGAGGFGLGEGEGVGLQPLGVDVGGGGVEPGPAAAEKDGQEGATVFRFKRFLGSTGFCP